MKVGFVGMGVMGTAMARNLKKSGFEVFVFNRSSEKAKVLAAEGLAVVERAADLGTRVETLCVCVTDGAAVREVLFGPSGAVVAGGTIRSVIDFSTIAPSECEAIVAELQEQGVRYLDAPVTGGDIGARDGTLTVMVGGETKAFESAKPIFAAIGRKVVHLGPVGAGQRAKCVNQVAVAVSIAAMTEAMVFARGMGLDVAQVLDLIGSGAAGSWAIQNYAPRILRGEMGPGFYAKHMLKDLRIAGRQAELSGSALPVTGLVRELYTALCAGGGADLGNHALLTLYDRLSDDDRSSGERTKGERE